MIAMLLVDVPLILRKAPVMPMKAGISVTLTSLPSTHEAATYAALINTQKCIQDPDLRKGDDYYHADNKV